MKHNATYISLPLFILLYIAFSDCADPSEKKGVSNSPLSPVLVYLPPSQDSNLKKCLFWRLSKPIHINDEEGNEKKLDPFPREFACPIIDLCIIEETPPIINGIIKAAKDHPSDSLDNIKKAWGKEYIEKLPMGAGYCERLQTIESFNPKDSDLYCLSEPNDKDTKDTPDERNRKMKKMILSQMTLSLQKVQADDKMALLVPSECEQIYQNLLTFPPADFAESNPDFHLIHLFTVLAFDKKADLTICFFNHSVDHEDYFSNKEQIDVIFPILISDHKYNWKKSTCSTCIQRSDWHVAAESEQITLSDSS